MDKKILIDWLEDINDINKTMKFLYHWIRYKMPDLDENRLKEFINKLYHRLMIPSFGIDPVIWVLQDLVEIAKIELEVNSIVKTNDYKQHIKYY